MITIRQLREAMAEIVSQIPEIHKVRYVDDDDQLADRMEKHKESDNTMLVCLVPNYTGFGDNEDITGYMSYLQFFLLDKVDYKKFRNDDDYLDVLIKIQDIVSDFMRVLFDYQIGECLLFGNLKHETLVIRSVKNKAQCMGWEIQVDDKTYSGPDGLN